MRSSYNALGFLLVAALLAAVFWLLVLQPTEQADQPPPLPPRDGATIGDDPS